MILIGPDDVTVTITSAFSYRKDGFKEPIYSLRILFNNPAVEKFKLRKGQYVQFLSGSINNLKLSVTDGKAVGCFKHGPSRLACQKRVNCGLSASVIGQLRELGLDFPINRIIRYKIVATSESEYQLTHIDIRPVERRTNRTSTDVEQSDEIRVTTSKCDYKEIEKCGDVIYIRGGIGTTLDFRNYPYAKAEVKDDSINLNFFENHVPGSAKVIKRNGNGSSMSPIVGAISICDFFGITKCCSLVGKLVSQENSVISSYRLEPIKNRNKWNRNKMNKPHQEQIFSKNENKIPSFLDGIPLAPACHAKFTVILDSMGVLRFNLKIAEHLKLAEGNKIAIVKHENRADCGYSIMINPINQKIPTFPITKRGIKALAVCLNDHFGATKAKPIQSVLFQVIETGEVVDGIKIYWMKPLANLNKN